jgi:phage-related baseplate assembly protein
VPNIEEFRNIPDINFIDGVTLENLRNEAVADYESEYERITGESKTLYPADPIRILLYTYTLKLYQLYQYVDRSGKQDLLKYSRGGFLDNIAALRSVARLPIQAAQTLLTFTLSAPLEYAALIPMGKEVTGGDNVFFRVTRTGEIPIGEIEVTLPAVCTQSGSVGNQYPIGILNTIVQPLPFTPSVRNISPASGGVDEESDQSLAERTFLAPSGFSVAGPDEAYIFWVKTYSQAITDVNVFMPEPGTVDIRILLNDGELPGQGFIEGLFAFLKENKVRPLTDKVLIAPPDLVDYSIELIYYISTKDRNTAGTIQERVSLALKYYSAWQNQKIGRDINPDTLRQLFREAGAKRLDLRSPDFTLLTGVQLARLVNTHVVYGGLEDD